MYRWWTQVFSMLFHHNMHAKMLSFIWEYETTEYKVLGVMTLIHPISGKLLLIVTNVCITKYNYLLVNIRHVFKQDSTTFSINLAGYRFVDSYLLIPFYINEFTFNMVALSEWIIKITLCATQNLVRDGFHIVEFIIVLKASCNVLFLNVVEQCVDYV